MSSNCQVGPGPIPNLQTAKSDPRAARGRWAAFGCAHVCAWRRCCFKLRGGGRLVITLEPARGSTINTAQSCIHWPRCQTASQILCNCLEDLTMHEFLSDRWQLGSPPQAMRLRLSEQLEILLWLLDVHNDVGTMTEP